VTLLRPDAVRQTSLNGRPIDLDAPIRWDCSSKGWNCCVDYGIPVMPYDVVRLRHAAGKPSQDLIAESVVTFQWAADGVAAWLAQKPHQGNHRACFFYEELTTEDIRRIRDEEPARFASFPPSIRSAADRTQGGSHRVAGLCGAHQNRPEACRSFPFLRRADWEGTPEVSPALQVHRCGTCALSTQTTVRQILLDNGLEEFWRADLPWRQVKRYLHARGLANPGAPGYRALPLAGDARSQLWGDCFNPDSFEDVQQRYPNQWQRDMDLEGDREIHRLVLTATLDRADELVASSGIAIDELGPEGAPTARAPGPRRPPRPRPPGPARRLRRRLIRAAPPARYSSRTVVSAPTGMIDKWDIGDPESCAPCQCSSVAGTTTQSPALITCSPSRSPTFPIPETTYSTWSRVCVCHPARAPGAKCTTDTFVSALSPAESPRPHTCPPSKIAASVRSIVSPSSDFTTCTCIVVLHSTHRGLFSPLLRLIRDDSTPATPAGSSAPSVAPPPR